MHSTEQNSWENIFIPPGSAGLLSISEVLGQEYMDPLALPCFMALLFSTVVRVSDASEGWKAMGRK